MADYQNAITFCDNCGCNWLDDGLNPIGCPYCKLSAQAAEIEALLAEVEALREELAALKYENAHLREALKDADNE